MKKRPLPYTTMGICLMAGILIVDQMIISLSDWIAIPGTLAAAVLFIAGGVVKSREDR